MKIKLELKTTKREHQCKNVVGRYRGSGNGIIYGRSVVVRTSRVSVLASNLGEAGIGFCAFGKWRVFLLVSGKFPFVQGASAGIPYRVVGFPKITGNFV